MRETPTPPEVEILAVAPDTKQETKLPTEGKLSELMVALGEKFHLKTEYLLAGLRSKLSTLPGSPFKTSNFKPGSFDPQKINFFNLNLGETGHVKFGVSFEARGNIQKKQCDLHFVTITRNGQKALEPSWNVSSYTISTEKAPPRNYKN